MNKKELNSDISPVIDYKNQQPRYSNRESNKKNIKFGSRIINKVIKISAEQVTDRKAAILIERHSSRGPRNTGKSHDTATAKPKK